jgi:hypothetical protein
MLRIVAILALLALAAPQTSVAQSAEDPNAVEPTNGIYRVQQDSWVYRGPSAQSGGVRYARAGSSIHVIGATRDFVRVQTAEGDIGYLPRSGVMSFRPADENFILSRDTGVYAQSHLSSQQLTTVHRGRNVHVVGVEFSFLKIRMKSGLEGFIPVQAVE